MKKKETIFLICLCLLAIFLCLFRLRDTYVFAEDVARDTLRTLTIWQSKEITLIGPPASFTLNSDKQFYFGSFSLYLGLLGLLISNFNPIGATFPTITLFVISIPFFYLFCKNIRTSESVKFFATILYSVSPLVITHMRFFWNPNIVIPLSVFFWYLVTLGKNKLDFKLHFLAGFVMAVIFNLHYFTVLLMMIWMIIIIVKRECKKILGLITGFIIGSIPLVVYELRNNFYLTRALIADIGHQQSVFPTLMTFVGRTGEIFMAVIGLKHGEIYFPTLFENKLPWFWAIFLLIIILAVLTIRQKINEKRMILVMPMFLSIILAARVSDTVFYTRYVFGALPLVIWFIAEMLEGKVRRFLWLLVAILVISSSLGIIFFKNGIDTGYIPIKTLEEMAKKIINDDFKGNYNVTENISTDKYANGVRYFIQRDGINQPQDTNSYGSLTRLYVLATDSGRIIGENRPEYSISGPWKEPVITGFGEVKLYRFDK